MANGSPLNRKEMIKKREEEEEKKRIMERSGNG